MLTRTARTGSAARQTCRKSETPPTPTNVLLSRACVGVDGRTSSARAIALHPSRRSITQPPPTGGRSLLEDSMSRRIRLSVISTLLLAGLALGAAPSTAEAQFGKRLKDAVKRTAEDK